MQVLSIDPSYATGGLGYALLTMDDDLKIILDEYGIANADVAGTFEDKVMAAIRNLDMKFFCESTYDAILIEMPETWGGFKGSMSAKTGTIQKLYFFVGALYYWAKNITQTDSFSLNKLEIPTHLITPSQWKGQIPKQVIKGRVEREFGVKIKTDHESDAIGVGLYWLGKLKKETLNERNKETGKQDRSAVPHKPSTTLQSRRDGGN